jgi:O-antigen/teichoic acid export membrane protein
LLEDASVLFTPTTRDEGSTWVVKRALELGKHALRSPVTIYLGVAIASRGVSFFLIPLYARKLTVVEYGDFVLAQTAIGLLPMVLTLGLVSAVPRAFFREKERAEGMRRAGNVGAWAAVLGLATAALIELAILAFFPERATSSVGRMEASCVVLAAVGAALTSIPSVLYRAAQRPMQAAAFQTVEALSIAGFTVYFVVLRGMGLRGAVLGLTSAYALNGLVALFVIFGVLEGRPRRTELVDLLRFAFPFVPHHAANWAQQASDRWILKSSGYDAILGAFALAGQVLSPATMTLTAFHDYASARMGEAFREDGIVGLGVACRRQRRQYLLSALLPTVACVLMVPLLPYVVGRSYTAAFWTLPVLAIIGLIDSQYYPNSNVLYYSERTKLIPRVTVATAVANVAFNVALIPTLGLVGALIARGATILLRATIFAFLANAALASGGNNPSAAPPPR